MTRLAGILALLLTGHPPPAVAGETASRILDLVDEAVGIPRKAKICAFNHPRVVNKIDKAWSLQIKALSRLVERDFSPAQMREVQQRASLDGYPDETMTIGEYRITCGEGPVADHLRAMLDINLVKRAAKLLKGD